MLGQPGAMIIILQEPWLGILFMALAIRGVGGKAYLSMSHFYGPFVPKGMQSLQLFVPDGVCISTFDYWDSG